MDDVRAELLRLEQALAQRRPDELPGGYAGALHLDFREIGASGRRWTRGEMLDALAAAGPGDAEIADFEVEELAPGLILATYDTVGPRRARRSSVWALDEGRWRIRFHQGTPA